MDAAHEERQLAEVQERLEARFPELDPTIVAAAIQLAAASITGPVRDYVALLVERAARERLQALVGDEATAGGSQPQDARTPEAPWASPARAAVDAPLGS